MKPIRLMSGFLTVGVWTLASRVLGFVRDIMIVAWLGSGPVAEAFFIAFSLPNMFRRFFAEGAFNMAFVPMFSKKLEGGEGAREFAQDAFSGLASLLIAFTVIALFAMPWLVIAMASGFLADERFDLAIDYGRIAFPYVLIISLAALLSGLLNATGRFAAAAAAPVLLNVLFIGSITLAVRLGWPLGTTLAWTVPIGGIAQLALVWVAAARAGFALRLGRPRLTPDLKRLAIIAAPAALAGGVVQINLLIGRQVASFFDGAIVWLNVADRLYQLPLGVVGIAIGVVLLRLGGRGRVARRRAVQRHGGAVGQLARRRHRARVQLRAPQRRAPQRRHRRRLVLFEDGYTDQRRLRRVVEEEEAVHLGVEKRRHRKRGAPLPVRVRDEIGEYVAGVEQDATVASLLVAPRAAPEDSGENEADPRAVEPRVAAARMVDPLELVAVPELDQLVTVRLVVVDARLDALHVAQRDIDLGRVKTARRR